MPRSLFVTVGSTRFQALTDAVLSPSALDALSSVGVTTLVVQLGSADIPAHVGVGAQGGEWAHGALGVTVLRYTVDAAHMARLLAASDAVVSHAGAGSILQVLRLPRPLLVVPNTALMDNHQQELADALRAGDYLTVASVDHLLDGLKRLLANPETKPFPAFEPARFRSILDETAGFA
ncbi:UDP-N-acetylglucosamine transferase subunit ALG13 [Vanrija pseudolonga]|uniref:UDP-N-acetylglucosamine transferase subunit ALG13 n=1 Tax=Vanrija pseudolonga TaxID=143232 RepID=A0AAF0Y674_9TREE|nr:UDP-N-acetylglucosamine transferase subunit ALG13 [Vanrija pseudolonga]